MKADEFSETHGDTQIVDQVRYDPSLLSGIPEELLHGPT
jgi:hypothetical protein